MSNIYRANELCGTYLVLEDIDILEIENCNFQNSVTQNGGINIQEIRKATRGDYLIKIQNSVFNNNSGPSNAIHFQDLPHKIIFDNITVSNNYQGQSIYLKQLLNEQTQLINSNFKYNFFENNFGSCLYADYISDLILENLNISYNKGHEHNFYLFYILQLKFTNSIVYNNTGYQNSGIYIYFAKQSEIKDITFSQNYAQDKIPALSLDNCQLADIQNLIFEKNQCDNQSGAVRMSYCSNNNIQNLYFKGNQAQSQGSSLSIISGNNNNFTDIYIEDSISLVQNGAVYTQYIRGYNFINMKFINCQSVDQNGAGMYFHFGIQIQILNSHFEDNQASIGGAIVLYETQELLIQNSNFTKNLARTYAGAIYIFKGSVKLENIIFQGNQVTSNGGALYVENVGLLEMYNVNFNKNICNQGQGGAMNIFNSEKIEIFNSFFTQNVANNGNGGAIFINQLQYLMIQFTEIYENQNAIQGGAVYATNFGEINIENTQIKNHKYDTLNQGGALYLYIGVNFILQSSQISENKAQYYGGAIYFYDIQNILINNSTIKNNLVKTNFQDINPKGGGIYSNLVKSITVKNSLLQDNQAFLHGGALYLLDVEIVNIQESIFKQNTVFYNKDSYQFQKTPDYLVTKGGAIFFSTLYLDNIYQIYITIQGTTFHKNEASSGGGVMIQLDPGFKFTPNFENLNFENNLADIGPAVRFLGDNEDYFQNLNEKADIKSINNKGNIEYENIYWTFTYYEKKIQEKSNEFVLCDSGYFIKSLKSTTCENCIDNAVCKGGYIPLYPDKDYWRTSTDELDLYYCENYQEACPGNDTCKIGHTGPLCESCDIYNGYGPFGIECQKCTSQDSMVIFKVFLLCVCILVIVCYQIYGIKKKIQKKQLSQIFFNLWDYPINTQSNLSGIIKITILHCQIIYLIASFTLNVPFEVITIFEIIGNPQTTLSTNLICILAKDLDDPKNVDKVNYIISVYALCIIIMLLSISLITELILHVFFKFYKSRKQFLDYLKCSVICFLITVQPGILQNSLEFVKCREIAGTKYSSADLFVKCESDFFQEVVFPINLALIILLGVFVPVGLIFILVRGNQKNLLTKYSFQRRFGVLFIEVKSQYYFWDIITMFLKLFAVGFSILFSESVARKGILVNLILIIYLILCKTIHPFITQKLNKLQVYSIVAMIFTISIGMVMDTLEDDEQTTEQILSLVIIFINGFYAIVSAIYVAKEFRVHFYIYLNKFRNRLSSKINAKVQKEISKIRATKLRWIKLRLMIRNYIKNEKGNSHVFKSFVQYQIFNSLNHGKNNLQQNRLNNITQQLSFHNSQHNQSENKQQKITLKNQDQSNMLNSTKINFDKDINNLVAKIKQYSPNKSLQSFLNFKNFQQNEKCNSNQVLTSPIKQNQVNINNQKDSQQKQNQGVNLSNNERKNEQNLFQYQNSSNKLNQENQENGNENQNKSLNIEQNQIMESKDKEQIFQFDQNILEKEQQIKKEYKLIESQFKPKNSSENSSNQQCIIDNSSINFEIYQNQLDKQGSIQTPQYSYLKKQLLQIDSSKNKNQNFIFKDNSDQSLDSNNFINYNLKNKKFLNDQFDSQKDITLDQELNNQSNMKLKNYNNMDDIILQKSNQYKHQGDSNQDISFDLEFY